MSKKRGGRWFGITATLLVGGLLIAERKRGLRSRGKGGPPVKRLLTNVAIAGVTAAVTELAMSPVVGPASRYVERRRTGLVQRLPLSPVMRTTMAIVLMDYTLYWWHVIEHRIPLLYRMHQVHHADLELDVSTAARFHFAEFLASVPWRAAQVLVIGVTPGALLLWQRLTMLSVLFHHSNVRLPLSVERWVARIITTPRLHGIHHSVVREEQDSNWSSGLTLWDRLHGTYRANVHQDDIDIGMPFYRDPEDVTLLRSMEMPLETLPEWRLPDGTVPESPLKAAPRGRLLE